jgi:acylphosphatase
MTARLLQTARHFLKAVESSGGARRARQIPAARQLFGVRAMLSSGMAARKQTARRWVVRGRVQGVGFRYFAQRAAAELGLAGYVRNLADGCVEVYAAGPEEKLAQLAGKLHRGPQWAEVQGVDEQEAEVRPCASFEIEP